MKMIAVIAKIKAKEGKAEEIIQLFRDIVPKVRQEEGTLYYTLNREPAKPDVLVVMERYRDRDALKVHSKTPHFLEMFQKMGPFVDGAPELSILDEIIAL
jgi:quinol monooxygenase YgiN